MFKEGWGEHLAVLMALIWIITFTILGIIWKIDLLSLIFILIGGAITVWYGTILVLNFITLLIKFIKN